MAAAEVAPEIIIISIGTAGQPEAAAAAANLTPIAKRRAIITKRVASRSVRSRSSSSSHGVAVRATSTTMTTTSWPTGRPTARAPAIVPTMHGHNRPSRMHRVTSMAHLSTTILITISTIVE
uniref:(northern house mosquito) hypothetical protein n=1 Tax=Culex pipiens TaxID=7175 RepID=A0A8D8KTX7_CULPI